MVKDICQIYVIRNTVNDKVYVGQTWRSLKKRLERHACDKGCPKINRAINKYGKENFSIEPILSVQTQEDANFFEIYFIELFDSIKNGYNLKLGGDGGKHSEETKQKMIKSRTGLKRSEEHKRKLSKLMKGMHNAGAFQMGHAMSVGSKHAQAKLNEKQVKQIKQLLQQGMFESAIAKQFGVVRSTIAAIKQKRSWKNVPWE